MSRRHLGAEAAAFVDGSLSLEARERVVAHLAHCDPCRRTVADQRRIKALLASLPAPPVPPGLLDRLAAISGPSGRQSDPRIPVPRGFGPGGAASPVPAAWTPPLATGAEVLPFPGHRAPRERRPGRRRAAAVAASAGGVAVVVAVATAGAAPQAVANQPVTPPVQRFEVEHAAVSGALPLTTPGLRVVPATLLRGVAPTLASAPATTTWASTDPFAPVVGAGVTSR